MTPILVDNTIKDIKKIVRPAPEVVGILILSLTFIVIAAHKVF
jgi:hypothetical protein